jgi:hypothetical protein
MTPLLYQVVGEEEYALRIRIDADGRFTVDSGTYTTQPPRKGTLSQEQTKAIEDALRELGTPAPHPMPDGSTAFEAHLTIGDGENAHEYPFWEGALEDDVPLNRVVRLIERL